MKKIKVIGCGSLLMGDDAAGCIVARKLQKMDLPGNVEVLEAGTPGLNLLNLMEPGERVIIVDAVYTGSEPGTIEIFLEDQIPRPEKMPFSAHQIAIPEAITLGRAVEPERMPDSIEIWGIEVKMPVEFRFKISPPIEKAVVKVVEMLRVELGDGGI